MTSKKKQVKWFPPKNRLNEIYQQTGMHFAFVSSPKDGDQVCHDWVKCRDYMPDAVRTQLTGERSQIYGFTYEKGVNPPIDLRKMRMLVSKEGLKTDEQKQDFLEMMQASLRLVNYYEKLAGVSLSRMYQVDPEGQTRYNTIIMFVGPIMWMQSPFLVSMYSFLLRLGHKKIVFKNGPDLRKKLEDLSKATNRDNDQNYLKGSWDKMHLVIKKRSTLFPKKKGVHDIFWKNIHIDNFHNRTGLVALVKGNTPDNELNKRVKEVL